MRYQILIASAFMLTSSIAWADPAEVSQLCAAGSNCTTLVNEEIAGMQGSQAEKDEAIADLVVSIGTESQTANAERCKEMAVAVRASASSVSDAGQQARITEIADSMCKSQIQTAAIGDDSAADDGGERNEQPASSN